MDGFMDPGAVRGAEHRRLGGISPTVAAEGRMPGVMPKVGRSPAGRAKALLLENKNRKIKLDYTRHSCRVRFGPSLRDVRSGILPPQSSFRWNDEQR
jgi:hypothetical protein